MRLTICLSLVAAFPVFAQDKVKIDEPTKKSIAKALEWLAAKQNGDGSWSESRYPKNTAITSYALLAFLSQGNIPGQGLYGPEVTKGTRFLLSTVRDDGYLVGTSGGNMYCHGMATLALAQLWGMTGDNEIKPVLTKAVNLIVKSQNAEGGWRYNPTPTGADISVTIMQVMALRAAKNAGMNVPDQTMKDAIKYIESCYVKERGGFAYQPRSRSPGFARTAAGCCSLMLAGQYNAKQLPDAIKYLKEHMDGRTHYFYGHYYACHVMHQVGGKEWEEYYAKMCKYLREKQSSDGSWSENALDSNHVGPIYQTAISVIVLSVPAHYLPIFQR